MILDKWLFLDTEITGLAAPVFIIELAAQRLRSLEASC